MRAITFLGEGRHALVERPDPGEPPAGAAVVEVAAAGICGSDLLILSQPPRHPATLGIVLGHEFGGTVRAVGEGVDNVAPGDRVVIDPARGCGSCPWCLRGQPEGCPGQVHLGITIDGGFTDLALVPAWSLVRLEADLPWRQAVLNEPLGVVLAGLTRVAPQPGETAVVLGGGPIGLLFCAVLSSMGVEPLTVVEPKLARRELALACGATHAVEPEDATLDGYRRATGARLGPSLVVDATGFLLDRAVDLVDHGGRILCVGYDTAARPPVHTARIVDGTISIHGTAGGFHQAARARDMLAAGRVPAAAVVTDEMALEDLDHAMTEMRAGRAGKVVLRP